jgi:hypothetical protein
MGEGRRKDRNGANLYIMRIDLHGNRWRCLQPRRVEMRPDLDNERYHQETCVEKTLLVTVATESKERSFLA